jgi:hypothetical protein
VCGSWRAASDIDWCEMDEVSVLLLLSKLAGAIRFGTGASVLEDWPAMPVISSFLKLSTSRFALDVPLPGWSESASKAC